MIRALFRRVQVQQQIPVLALVWPTRRLVRLKTGSLDGTKVAEEVGVAEAGVREGLAAQAEGVAEDVATYVTAIPVVLLLVMKQGMMQVLLLWNL
ncbi:MAG: hypothetical protein HC767_02185 [Akkermansiaceae bacterium]|nr:hypothetical protein [Akkermansiaceae bacterium]